MYTPFSTREIEPLTKFSKRRVLTVPQFLEGGCWERGGDFFQGGCSFCIKANWNLTTKKIINKKVFLCHNYEFKLGNVAKNLVTFKRWDGVKDEKF